MDNPLENDVKRGPEEEIRDPEPREALQKLCELEGNVVSKTAKTMHHRFPDDQVHPLTRLFRDASPSRKTALTECIPISNCQTRI